MQLHGLRFQRFPIYVEQTLLYRCVNLGETRQGCRHAKWFSNFSGTRVHHVDSTTSDHKLLWIQQVGLEFQ